MKESVADLARYRMKKAEECFREGELLLAQGSLFGTVNRFYYATFNSARALLAVKEVDATSHSGVITLFSKHIVKEGLIFPETAKALSRALERRLDADYEDYAEVSLKEVERMRDEVRRFIESCSDILREILKEEKR